jgi:hypothetical protein
MVGRVIAYAAKVSAKMTFLAIRAVVATVGLVTLALVTHPHSFAGLCLSILH